MGIGAIVGSLISYLLTWLAQMALMWFSDVYSDMFYNAMAVETSFRDIVARGYINLSGLYGAIYTFAIALLIMFFVKKLTETYFAWSNGDPETSPFSILIGFLKAMIIMICFGFIYETFVKIFYQLFDSLLMGGFGTHIANAGDDIKKFVGTLGYLNFIGRLYTLIIAILFILIYFQNLGRGIEMLILRLGMPFACIGLLNSDGGAFKGYFQKMIKVGFTVVLQLLLLRFTISLVFTNHVILALATGLMAYRTPGILNEFMATSGQGYYGARGVTKMIGFRTLASKGRK